MRGWLVHSYEHRKIRLRGWFDTSPTSATTNAFEAKNTLLGKAHNLLFARRMAVQAAPRIGSTSENPLSAVQNADDIAALGEVLLAALRQDQQQKEAQKQQQLQAMAAAMQDLFSRMASAAGSSGMPQGGAPQRNAMTAAAQPQPQMQPQPQPQVQPETPGAEPATTPAPEVLRGRNQPAEPVRQPRNPGRGVPRGTTQVAYRDYQQNDQRLRQEDPRYRGELDRIQRLYRERQPLIDQIARRANLPPQLVAGLWYRENAQMRTDIHLHNGQQLGRPTTIVPRGIYFGRDQFVDAAVHALQQKAGTARELGLNYHSTDRAAMAAFAERYNGFGYRNRGVRSAYVTAGTGLYNGGMYVRDGVFNPNAWDRRPGVASIVNRLLGS